MRLKALLLVLFAAAAVAPLAPAQETEGETDVPLVRMRDGHGGDLFFRVNPATLREVGRPIRTFTGGYALALSPDGARLAFTGAHGLRSEMHLVDLARWRSLGKVRLGNRGPLVAGWAGPDRVVAIMGDAVGPSRLVWVDATSRRVVARRPYSGRLVESAAVPGGFALALAPESGVGPTRITVAGADGTLRRIRVDGIQSGGTEGERRARFVKPALAVDHDGGRLFVVAADELEAAEVNLASGAVSYHSLGASSSKGNVDMSLRYAEWLGDGRIAVTGENRRPGRGRRPPPPPVAFGARVIDTERWSIETLDRRPFAVHAARHTLLAYGTRWFRGNRPPKHTGLLAFDVAGRRAFTRFRRMDISLLGSRGDVAYVWVRRARRVHLIDLRDGHTIREVRTARWPPSLVNARG
jgi:hypothetical protein